MKRKYEATFNNKKTKLVSNEAMTTIKMKLTTILVQSELTTSFQHCLCSTVDNLTRVQFLASHILNYHLLRLIEEELNLSEFDLSFFQIVCTIVTDTINWEGHDGWYKYR